MAKIKPLDGVIRVRVPSELSERVARIASHRGCDKSDVTRESLLNFVQAEETRLGIEVKPIKREVKSR